MTLSDTQLMLLSSASQREDLLVTLPAPPKTGSARTSLSKLLSQGLVEEVAVTREQPDWRTHCTPESTASQNEAASVGSPSIPRDGSKQALVISLLRRGEGAGLGELAAATGWLPHTTRAALTGLRKKGYALVREKGQSGTSVYRIVGREA
jgi:hypothetical protein